MRFKVCQPLWPFLWNIFGESFSTSSWSWVGSRATLFRTPPGPAIQLATKPAFHLVIRSSLNPTEIPLNLTENPLNLTERARNQTERIAVSNAALIAKLMASKLLGSKEKDLFKLLNPPKVGAFLLTVKHLGLQSLKVLIRRTFPL